MVREYSSNNAESEVEVGGQENSISISEEDELMQTKNDFVIEHDEMVAYETLSGTDGKYAPVARVCVFTGKEHEGGRINGILV